MPSYHTARIFRSLNQAMNGTATNSTSAVNGARPGHTPALSHVPCTSHPPPPPPPRPATSSSLPLLYAQNHYSQQQLQPLSSRRPLVVQLLLLVALTMSVALVANTSLVSSASIETAAARVSTTRTATAFAHAAAVEKTLLLAQQSTDDRQLEDLQKIFCRGPLLHDVQMTRLFVDSKHFVDMPLKNTTNATAVMRDYDEMMQSYGSPEAWAAQSEEVRKKALLEFMHSHFDPPGSDLVPAMPLDYQEETLPPQIAAIREPELQQWAFDLHKLWKVLGRVPTDVGVSSYLHARAVKHDTQLQRAQNVLVVPGGRFRESYYWDSYWIIQGLLVSGMNVTARGVVNNLLEYVAEFGFVPNGGRIYYLTRSQPPVLSDMVKVVARMQAEADETNEDTYDLAYLKSAVPLLELEYKYWMQTGPSGSAVEIEKVVDGKSHTYILNRYIANANEPRPESYREDVVTANAAFGNDNSSETIARKELFYNEIIAGAESGWDFSSRWFQDDATLATIQTSQVIPVDLNAILYRMESNLAHFNKLVGNDDAADSFKERAARRIEAIDAVLWNSKVNSWKDYRLDTKAHSAVVSVSDYSPLWAKAFDPADKDRLKKILASFKQSKLFQVGGIQMTTLVSTQQWDAPNAWPPEQDIIVQGLLSMDSSEAEDLAREIVQTWVKAGFIAWKQTGQMFEKYNGIHLGGIGRGGEYVPQLGFGWSNGVILKFLTKYQHFLNETDIVD